MTKPDTPREKDDYFCNGKPIHRQSYCAFLDILGFSAKINESYKNNTENELLRDFHDILSKMINELKEQAEDSMFYFKSFTDNVVLAHPKFSDDMEAEFGFIISPIMEYQFQMALKGFFIRGGLALGPLFMDEDSVYGSALLKAHEIESSIAINPSVVLCENTVSLVKKHMEYYFCENAPQSRDILKDNKGHYFLNYLTECLIDNGNENSLDITSLKRHKNQIEDALRENENTQKVFSKFVWLALYHNYFCEQVSGYPNYLDSLKISSTLTNNIFFEKISKSE